MFTSRANNASHSQSIRSGFRYKLNALYRVKAERLSVETNLPWTSNRNHIDNAVCQKRFFKVSDSLRVFGAFTDARLTFTMNVQTALWFLRSQYSVLNTPLKLPANISLFIDRTSPSRITRPPSNIIDIYVDYSYICQDLCLGRSTLVSPEFTFVEKKSKLN